MWIICCGGKRSGSTLHYNIVATLVEKSSQGKKLGFLTRSTFLHHREMLTDYNGLKIFKSHILFDEILEEFSKSNAKAIYCYRDLRDVITSLSIKSGKAVSDLIDRKFVENYIEKHNNLLKLFPIYCSRYEDFVFDIYSEAKRISTFLELSISTSSLKEIHNDLNIDKQKQKMMNPRNPIVQKDYIFDSNTLLHTNHIDDGKIGKWKKKLSRKTIKVLEHKIYNWLLNNGYSLSNATLYNESILYSYSQHGEDDLIWKFFRRKRTGLIVEVGAFDGIHLSNSYALEKIGWQSILIEANPKYFSTLELNRPHAMNIHAACVANQGVSEILFQQEELGLLSGVAIDEEDIKRRYKNRGLEYNGINELAVPASTLDEILEQNDIRKGIIDCITIDVEGYESEVLKGFSIGKYEPKLIIIEVNDQNSYNEIKTFMNNHTGYCEGRKLGVNLVYARGKRRARYLSSIFLDAAPQKQMHPLGEKYTIQGVMDNSGFKPTVSYFFRKIISRLRKIIDF